MIEDIVLIFFVICPVISMILGVLFCIFLYRWRSVALVISFFLPLLLFLSEKGFHWSDPDQMYADLEAWFFYGIAYAILCLVAAMITSAVKKKLNKYL